MVISHKLLGTIEFFVVRHSNCGMELSTGDMITSLLEKSLDTAKIDVDGWQDVGSSEGPFGPSTHMLCTAGLKSPAFSPGVSTGATGSWTG